MKKSLVKDLAAIAALAVCLVRPMLGAEKPCDLKLAPDGSGVEIKYRGQRILLYASGSNQFKPYVKELYTLRGDNVLRDSPPDHIHHHGLMYAIRVNGINFWEEVGEPGRERVIKLLTSSADDHRAMFSQSIHWTARTSNVPLLVETRTLALSVDPTEAEVALEWRSVFQVGDAPVKLTGSGYNGLGLRLPESFDHVARFQNSAALPYTAAAQWDITPAQWGAVIGKLGDGVASVLLFDDPANAGKTTFFSMLNPFAYLAVTQTLDREPIEHPPGDRFSLRYLVVVAAKDQTAEQISRRYNWWLGGQRSVTDRR